MILASLFTMYESFIVAQSSAGTAALSEVTTDLKGWYDPLKKLLWIGAGLCGLIAAVKVYWKITKGDNEASDKAMHFVFGAIALFAAELFLRKMFIE